MNGSHCGLDFRGWLCALLLTLAAAPASAQEECSHAGTDHSAIDRFCAMNNGMARFRIAGLWGFVDATGRVAVEPQFAAAQDFREGSAAVRRGEQWGLIDTPGQLARRTAVH